MFGSRLLYLFIYYNTKEWWKDEDDGDDEPYRLLFSLLHFFLL